MILTVAAPLGSALLLVVLLIEGRPQIVVVLGAISYNCLFEKVGNVVCCGHQLSLCCGMFMVWYENHFSRRVGASISAIYID
jgi:hypothetical protein